MTVFSSLEFPPNRPEIWGQNMRRMAETLNPGRGVQELSRYLTNGKDSRYRSLIEWLHGRFDVNKKQMTDARMCQIVEFFWKRPGFLEDASQVLVFLQCAGDRFVPLMEDRRIRALLDEYTPKRWQVQHDPAYTHPGTLLRRKEVGSVLYAVDKGAFRESPLVVLAPPGYGKTSLLALLTQEQALWDRFTDGFIYLPLSKDRSFSDVLKDLVYQVGVPLAWLEHDEHTLLRELTLRLESDEWVLMIDGVLEAETARKLMVTSLETSLVVITTCRQEVAFSLAKSENWIVPLLGFDSEEVVQYYYEQDRNRDLNADERPLLERLNQALRGRPSYMVTALKLADQFGFANALRLATLPPQEPLTGLLNEMFQADRRAYFDLMDDIYRLRLHQLLSTPAVSTYHPEVVAAIWNTDLTAAQRVLAIFERDLELIVTRPEENLLEVSEPVQRLAVRLTSEDGGENWEPRALQTDHMQKFLAEREQEVSDIPFRAAVKMYWTGRSRKIQGQSVWSRLWMLLINPDRVPKELVLQSLMCDMEDQDYLQAYHLFEEERRDRRISSWLMRICLVLIFAEVSVFVIALQQAAWNQMSAIWSLVIAVISIMLVVTSVFAIKRTAKTIFGPGYSDLQWERLLDRLAAKRRNGGR